ncbi:MAG: GatB/YqeY domain-containing protein [bacterium]
MTISEQIRAELKEAMIAKDSVKMMTLRGLLSGFTNELVAVGKKPQDIITDEEAIAVIKRAVKQRKDAIEQFTNGGRADLADSEKAELALLEVYMPAQMSREEIQKIVEAKKAELGVDTTDKTKAGLLMSTCMKELKGKADGGDVKAVVDAMFA